MPSRWVGKGPAGTTAGPLAGAEAGALAAGVGAPLSVFPGASCEAAVPRRPTMQTQAVKRMPAAGAIFHFPAMVSPQFGFL